MADNKIKDLTEKVTGAATDEFVINDVAGGDADKKLGMDGIRITESQVTDLGTAVTLNADTDVSGASWFLDEDNMASDDATKVASQQSVKAYVDTNAGISDVVSDTTPQLGGNLDCNAFHIQIDSGDTISFDGATEAQTIEGDAGGIISKVPTGDDFDYQVNSVSVLTISATGIDLQGNDLNNGGVIFLTEQADADADVAGKGQIWVNTATPNELYFTDDAGTDFQVASWSGTHAARESFIIAASDETTALTAGTGKVTFRMPYAFTVTEVRASLTGAGSTSGTTTVDINEGGTSILSTKLTIDNTEKTSESAATPPVISDSSLADDAEITIDIDAVTGGADETGLKVYIIGYKT